MDPRTVGKLGTPPSASRTADVSSNTLIEDSLSSHICSFRRALTPVFICQFNTYIMSRAVAPADLKKFASLRIGNIPEDMKTELIYQDFELFGEIGDFYRPNNLQRGMPSRYAFVRYVNKDDADKASMEMHGKRYGANIITVEDSTLQNSFFTQDTGFITNTMFDTPKVVENKFNPALPENHYPLKRKEQLKNLSVDEQVTLRIDDLHKDISKEQLDQIFSQFGEVTSIYYPMDLKARMPKGFAFVRYANQRSAERAAEAMNDTNLGVGRNIQDVNKKSTHVFSQKSRCSNSGLNPAIEVSSRNLFLLREKVFMTSFLNSIPKRKKSPDQLVLSSKQALQTIIDSSVSKEDERIAAIENLAKYLVDIKVVLCGNAENLELDEEKVLETSKYIQSEGLMKLLISNFDVITFETRKDTTLIYNNLVRKNINGFAQYLFENVDILQMLLQGYLSTDSALSCGSMLRESLRHENLARYVLFSEFLWAFFDTYVHLPDFEVASDAFNTLRELLTLPKHKHVIEEFMETQGDKLLEKYDSLLQSDNYLTRRRSLKLLSELLLDRSNYTIMMKYISSKNNLKTIMNLLRHKSPQIQFETFHVFKIFVANPSKTAEIESILSKNKSKLIAYLEVFHTDNEDPQFVDEKRLLIDTLQQLTDGPVDSPAGRRHSHSHSNSHSHSHSHSSSHRTSTSDRDSYTSETTSAVEAALISAMHNTSLIGAHASSNQEGDGVYNANTTDGTTDESRSGEDTKNTIGTNDTLTSANSQSI